MHFHLTTVLRKAKFYFTCFSFRTVKENRKASESGNIQDICFTLDIASSELHCTWSNFKVMISVSLIHVMN